MALGTDHATTTTQANFIPELWSDEVVASYKENLVMANLVTRMNHRGKKGDTIHIPKPTRGTASSKAAETEVTLIANTEGEQLVSIDKHFHYARMIEDIANVQQLDSFRRFYTDDAGHALARQTDTHLIELGANLQGGTAYSAAVSGDDGSTAWDGAANTNTGNGGALTDAGIRQMVQTLDDEDVPMRARNMVIPPVAKNTLLGLDRFSEQSFVGEAGANNSIRTGRVGNVYGVEVFVSTNAASVQADDGSTNYRVALMFQRDAFVLVEQLGVRTQTQDKLEYLGTLFVADTIYGVSELRDNGGVAAIVPA